MIESLNLADFGVEAARFTSTTLVTRDCFGNVVDAMDSQTNQRVILRLLYSPLDEEAFKKCIDETDKDHFMADCSLISDRAIRTVTEGFNRISDLNKLDNDTILPLAEFESLGVIGAVLPILLKAEIADKLIFNVKPSNLYVKPLIKGRPPAGQSSHHLSIGEPYQHLLYTRDAKTSVERYAPKDYLEDRENRLAFSLGCLMHHMAFGDDDINSQKENNAISYLYSHYMFNLLKANSKERQSLGHFERSLRTLKDCETLVIYPTAKVVNLVTAKGIYTGSMKYGLMHGKGIFTSTKEVYTMLEVRKYDGYYCLDKMHGRGTIIFRSGDCYSGHIEWDHPKGWGSMTRMSGTRLSGCWEGSQLNEDHEAEIVIPDYSSYRGMTCKNLPHGHGVMNYNDGSTYEGDFKQNVRHGRGTMVKIVEGEEVYRYEGQWHENEKHGEGEESVPGKYEYVGNLHNGRRQGQGKLTSQADGYSYEGEFRSDKFNGFGQIEYDTGEKYNGQFKNGSRDGFGCSEFPDGTTYEGQWEKDVQHGEGTMTTLTGDLVSGVWVEGQLLRDDFN